MSEIVPAVALEEAERAFAWEIKKTTERDRGNDDAQNESAVLLPTGVSGRRVFVVAQLDNVIAMNVDEGSWRGRLLDPTGAVLVHVGRHQRTDIRTDGPNESPVYVAVVGTPRHTVSARGSDYISLFPDRIGRVDEERMKEWVVETSDRTLERIECLEREATDEATLARKAYDIDPNWYREVVVDVRDGFEGMGYDEARHPFRGG